jgi:hypothetical protein
MAQIFILQTKIDCCRLKLAIQRATSAVTVLPKFVSGGKFAQFPTGLFQAAAGNGRYCCHDSANARNLSPSSPLNPVLCKLYVWDEPE